MNDNQRDYLQTIDALSQLVREAIDCDFASKMSLDELTRRLGEVAREIEAVRGLEVSNVERLKKMQTLAEELQSHAPLAKAA